MPSCFFNYERNNVDSIAPLSPTEERLIYNVFCFFSETPVSHHTIVRSKFLSLFLALVCSKRTHTTGTMYYHAWSHCSARASSLSSTRWYANNASSHFVLPLPITFDLRDIDRFFSRHTLATESIIKFSQFSFLSFFFFFFTTELCVSHSLQRTHILCEISFSPLSLLSIFTSDPVVRLLFAIHYK